MDLIIGGCHQGKTQYVMDVYGYGREDIMEGEKLDQPDMEGKKCLIHFHLLVRNLLEREAPVEEYLAQLLEKNDIQVIVTDEIGYGIVPMDAFEREYRETVGRQCCHLAGKAVKVWRVVAGLAVAIKE